ncbi:glycosyl hydrolase, partial [Paenibacillus riograndensis]
SYTVTTTVAADANELPAKQVNDVNTANLVVNAQGGASVPDSRYDTDDAVRGGAAVLKSVPDFDQSQIASEASGQRYIALPANGSYAQWTVRQGQGGAGITMRFTMPDAADGMGLNGSIDAYVNGVKVKTIALTSYYSWQYFSGDQPGDAPGAGRPLFRFDEVHWKLDTPLQAGDTIRIQKNNGDGLEYGVDFLEIEPVPAAIARPANSVSVTDHGAVANDGQDDLAAFNAAVTAAVSSGKALYIPAGTFNLSSMWQIGSANSMINNFTVTGAGFWHTNLQFTNPNAAGGGISLRISGKLDFSHVYMNSNLRSRHNQNAVYKGFMDNFGNHSIIHDVWVEHFECGMWVGDYAHTPAIYASGLVIENSRIRNNLADGINFSQGTSNSTVRNSNVRNNGDDGLAVWPSNTFGAPDGVNNTFSYNTIENNWRAGGIAIFGGSGHKADHNYIIDTVGGSGIRLNTTFPGAHFNNNTGILFSDTTIINSGTSQDLYNGERGAIDLEASQDPIKNVTFTNIDIINTQRDAIQLGYGGGFSNIVFNNITINGTGLDGVTTSRFSGAHKGDAINTYTGNGAATFNNLTTSNIAYPDLYYIQSGFGLTIQ